MSEYSPSAATRLALINAAGILFARQGIDAVTTRAIADAAHENKGSIYYHFGDKEDLVDAVLDYAAAPWKDDPLGRYVREHAKLLETPKGQDKVVEGLIDLAFAGLFSKEYPSWCSTLVFQILQKNMDVSDRVFKTCAKPLSEVFANLYMTITGDDDLVEAYSWAMLALSPLILQAISPTTTRRFFKGGKLPADYMAALKEHSKIGALAGLRHRKASKGGAVK